MKDVILLELAERWEREAKTPEIEDGSDDAIIDRAMAKARRECKREDADTLRVLVSMLGGA
ncbi:MAG: hypothetical protein PHZ02_07175 [Desulfocapsaceae bacterium]|nr:hypothetical protein [Desulfocapsaceae bacterium]